MNFRAQRVEVLGLWAACGLALSLALSASAQTASSPVRPAESAPAPAADSPVTEKPRSIVPSLPILTPGQKLPLDGVRPSRPETPGVDLGIGPTPALVREGAFISNARGQVVRGKSGRWYIVFDADESGRALPPMVLMENANLASIERLAERAPSGSRFRLSGQTTVYRERNFLIVSVPPLLERAAVVPEAMAAPAATPSDSAGPVPPATAAPAAAAAPPTKPAGGASSEPKNSEPKIEDIIADLDKAVGPRRTTTVDRVDAERPSTRQPGTDRPSDASNPDRVLAASRAGGGAGLAAENDPGAAGAGGFGGQVGGYLTSRRGRLVRAGDGTLLFRLDTGASGRSDPAFALLPCTNLTTLETWFDNAGESLPITLSGEVLLYKGRRLLLPSMFSMVRSTDLVLPTQ